MPTNQSVYRVVKHLDPGLLRLAQAGTKAYRTTFDLLYRCDAGTCNDLWQADHTGGGAIDLGTAHYYEGFSGAALWLPTGMVRE